jgi:transcriptional regulator
MGRDRIDLLQGTLDLLILRTLQRGAAHGHGIVQSIEKSSREVLRVDHGSLYPALQRLERRGWVIASWGTSENNRRARFYRLSAAGRRQLEKEQGRWEQLAQAIFHVLEPSKGGA